MPARIVDRNGERLEAEVGAFGEGGVDQGVGLGEGEAVHDATLRADPYHVIPDLFLDPAIVPVASQLDPGTSAG